MPLYKATCGPCNWQEIFPAQSIEEAEEIAKERHPITKLVGGHSKVTCRGEMRVSLSQRIYQERRRN